MFYRLVNLSIFDWMFLNECFINFIYVRAFGYLRTLVIWYHKFKLTNQMTSDSFFVWNTNFWINFCHSFFLFIIIILFVFILFSLHFVLSILFSLILFSLQQSMERDQLVMLHRHTSLLLEDNRFLILGGGGNCFSFGTHLNNTPVILDISKAWVVMKDTYM